MASKVRIVFANGSIAMANNANDTRERWELRINLTDNDIIRESRTGYTIPLLDAFATIEEISAHKQVLLEILTGAKLRIQHSVGNRQIGKDTRIQLEGVIAQVGQQIKLVDDLIADRRKRHVIKQTQLGYTKSAEENRQILQDYSRTLERILIDNNIPLPAPPFENWHKKSNAK